MVDFVELKLGKTATMVSAKEQPEKSSVIVKAAHTLLVRYLEKEEWTVSLIKEIIASDSKGKVNILIPVLREFTKQYYEQTGRPFGAFQGDDVIATCCCSLGTVYTNVIRYVFEVRVGLKTSVINAISNCWTKLYFPSRKATLGPNAAAISDVNIAVCSVNAGTKQPTIYFRGYDAHLCDVSGDVIFGGAGGLTEYNKMHGNLWLKDLWKMPGLRDADSLCEGKKNAARFRKNLEVMRNGATHEEFNVPVRRRLSVEDKIKFNLAIKCIRALRAKAVFELNHKQLDYFAGPHSRQELIADPTLAGDDSVHVVRILEEIKEAQQYLCELGSPVVPDCYVSFNVTAIPDVLQEEKFVTLKGVSSQCFAVKNLSSRRDRSEIITSPVLLNKYADFSKVFAISLRNEQLLPQVFTEPQTVNADSFVFAKNGVLCDLSAVNPCFTAKNNNVG